MLFEFGKVYNFNTISTTIIKPSYKNLKVTSYFSFKQAVKYSGVFNDVVTVRSQLIVETGLPLLPAKDAKYILFEDEYGEEILLAEDWINSDTIQLVSGIVASIKISSISMDDFTIILNTLRAMGYNDIESEVVSI